MKNKFLSFSNQQFLLTLVMFLLQISAGPYDEKIKTKIISHLSEKDALAKDKFAIEVCLNGKAPTTSKTPGCYICLSNLDEAQLNYQIDFVTPLETSKLIANNVSIDDVDEDFDIKNYVLNFYQVASFILNDDNLKTTIAKVLLSIATELGLKEAPNATDLKKVYLIGDDTDINGNSAIEVTINLKDAGVTFKTNFFENGHSLSIRHEKFVESELGRAWRQSIKGLKLMIGILGNNAGTKQINFKLECGKIMTSAELRDSLSSRLSNIGWTLGETQSDSFKFVTSKAKEIVLECKPFVVENSVGLIQISVKSNDNKYNANQSFLMYDLSGLINYWAEDNLTNLIRFYEPRNPEEKVDFGRKSLFEDDIKVDPVVEIDSQKKDISSVEDVANVKDEGLKKQVRRLKTVDTSNENKRMKNDFEFRRKRLKKTNKVEL